MYNISNYDKTLDKFICTIISIKTCPLFSRAHTHPPITYYHLLSHSHLFTHSHIHIRSHLFTHLHLLTHLASSHNLLTHSCLLTLDTIMPIHTHLTNAHTNKGLHMMTSSNGNIFRVTGPLCGEFTGHR